MTERRPATSAGAVTPRGMARVLERGVQTLALALAVAAMTGCPREREVTPPDADGSALHHTTPASRQACGSDGMTLTAGSIVPHDARSVVLFDLGDPSLETALPVLAHAAKAPPLVDAGLPVVVASDLSQWAFELRALSMHLASVGLHPRHVARALSPGGAGVWIVPSNCDLPELRTRALRSWKFLLRQSAEGWVGIPGEDSPSPWAVLVLSGDRLAFVPRASFEPTRAWIGEHSTSDESYSATLWSLPSAAIRAGLRTSGIRHGAAVDGSSPSVSTGAVDGADRPATGTEASTPREPRDPLQPLFFVVDGRGVAEATQSTSARPTSPSAATVAP